MAKRKTNTFLDGLLREEVVEPEDGLFRESSVEAAVQLARRLEVASEGLLDNDASAAVEAGVAQVADDRLEHVGRDGEVENRVGRRSEAAAEPLEGGRVGVVPWT